MSNKKSKISPGYNANTKSIKTKINNKKGMSKVQPCRIQPSSSDSDDNMSCKHFTILLYL